jgi:hypothetical protein
MTLGHEFHHCQTQGATHSFTWDRVHIRFNRFEFGKADSEIILQEFLETTE